MNEYQKEIYDELTEWLANTDHSRVTVDDFTEDILKEFAPDRRKLEVALETWRENIELRYNPRKNSAALIAELKRITERYEPDLSYCQCSYDPEISSLLPDQLLQELTEIRDRVNEELLTGLTPVCKNQLALF